MNRTETPVEAQTRLVKEGRVGPHKPNPIMRAFAMSCDRNRVNMIRRWQSEGKITEDQANDIINKTGDIANGDHA